MLNSVEFFECLKYGYFLKIIFLPTKRILICCVIRMEGNCTLVMFIVMLESLKTSRPTKYCGVGKNITFCPN